MKGKVKIISFFIVLVLLVGVFATTIKVFANSNTTSLSITFQNGYTSAQGKVQYSVDNGSTWVDVTENTNVTNLSVTGPHLQIKIVPAAGYMVDFTATEYQEDSNAAIAVRNDNNIAGGLTGNNGYYVDEDAVSVSLANVEFRQQDENPPEGNNHGEDIQVSSISFRLNGQDFAFDFENGESSANVPQNMNFSDVTELYIKQIVVKDSTTNPATTTTYNYTGDEYGLNLRDDENRPILESHLTAQTSNLAFFRVEAHVDGIKESDLTSMGKERDYFYGFYLPQIVFVKPNLSGLVEIKTQHMPDVYDFVTFNGVELGDTSESRYGHVTVYYGDDTIDLSGLRCNITDISLVDGKNVPQSAVDIDVANKKVRVKSNYYNNIPLKITAQNDGSTANIVGYINIERVGIYISDLNKNSTVFYHGAFNGRVNDNGGNLNVDTDKCRVVAVFYHDNTKTVNDFDLVVNIINEDGTTETKLAKPVGDVADEGSPLVGSDYILWEGDSYEEMPYKINVTAVKKGATTNTQTFGGATFGAGAGVTWVGRD